MTRFEKNLKKMILNEMKSPNNLDLIKSKLIFDTNLRETKLKQGIQKEISKKPRIKWLLIGTFSMLILIITILSFTFTSSNVPKYLGMEVVKNDRLSLSYDSSKLENTNNNVLDTDYFAKPGELIKIKINFDNPLDFEIISFTLNGLKYQSYQFEKNSTSENIYLMVKASEDYGVYTYIIDQIKYVDRTEIKNVIISGDTNLDIVVCKSILPFVEYEVENKATNLTFDFTVVDIENTSRKNCLVIVKNGEIISNQEINSPVITVDNLLPNTEYEIYVICYVSLLTEEGEKIYEASSSNIRTLSHFNVIDIVSTDKSITFNLDKKEDINIKNIEIYLDDELIKICKSINEINGLLSNKEYKIKILYEADCNGITEEYFYEFKCLTKANTKPTVYFDFFIEERNIYYEIKPTDINNTLKDIKVRLINEDKFIEKEELKSSFDNLQENQEYQIEVIFTYDLLDGLGIQTEKIVKNIETSIDCLSITNLSVLNDTINIDDVISMTIDFSSVKEVAITKIYINDKMYENEKANNKNSVLVNFIPEYEDYYFEYKIEKVCIELNGQEKVIFLDEAYFNSITIDETIDIISISNLTNNCVLVTDDIITNNRFLNIDLYVKIDNKIGGKILSVDFMLKNSYNSNIKNSKVTIIDEETIKITFSCSFSSLGSFYITAIYGIKDNENYKISYNYGGYIIITPVKSFETMFISSKDELINIENYYIYELKNDIDLSNSLWEIHDFIGRMNGNNYTITNLKMSIIKKYSVEDYIGIFRTVEKTIFENINFENVDLTFVYQSVANENAYGIYVGGLIGKGNDVIFDHVSINGKITIISDNNIFVAGICGYNNMEYLKKYNKTRFNIQYTFVQTKGLYDKVFIGEYTTTNVIPFSKDSTEIKKIILEAKDYD